MATTARPHPGRLEPFLEPQPLPSLRAVTLPKRTLPRGTFKHEVFATDKYVSVPTRPPEFGPRSANVLENLCDCPPSQQPPLSTGGGADLNTTTSSSGGGKSGTTMDQIWSFATSSAPGAATERAFAAESLGKLRVSAPFMRGSRVVQTELQPVQELTCSDCFCKLPSQRRQEHEQEVARLRADKVLREARVKHNVLRRKLATQYPSGYLGGTGPSDETLKRDQTAVLRHEQSMQKRHELVVRNEQRPGAGDSAMLQHCPEGCPHTPSPRRGRRYHPDQQTFSLEKMIQQCPKERNSRRAEKIAYQDNRGRGYDIISGVVDPLPFHCPYSP